MRNAYALLGLSFLIVFTGAYIIFNRAEAPSLHEASEPVDKPSEINMELTSSAFKNNEFIPSRYTCDGENISPPLTISNIPEGTESLVLIMDDPDIPAEIKDARGIEKFNHWVLYNIPPDQSELPAANITNLANVGINSAGDTGYRGPCPPTEYEPTRHRYVFRLYALPSTLNFIQAPTLDEVETAAQGSALGSAELIGLYERNSE